MTTIEPRKPKGGNMLGPMALVIAGAFLVLAAIFTNSTRDEDNYSDLKREIKEVKNLLETSKKSCQNLEDKMEGMEGTLRDVQMKWSQLPNAATEAIDKVINPLKKEFDTMQIRQTTLEKKQIGMGKDRNVNLTISKPIPVDIISGTGVKIVPGDIIDGKTGKPMNSKKLTGPPGKSLLQQSGVTK